MPKEPLQPQDKYVLRLPDGMRERIKRIAEKNNRSMNAEIVATLEREYPAPSDVMHVHLANIRRALDRYEREADPRTRLFLQQMVEAMVISGDNLVIDWDEDDDLPY